MQVTSSARSLVVGLDPFDALRGERVPSVVRRHPRLRQAIIQVRKRVPVDLASMLAVDPFPMAKTAGCLLTSAARGMRVGDPGAAEAAEGLCEFLLTSDEIARHPAGGFGYEFDVQTRWSFYPAGTPNVIATYFVGRGLLEYALVSGDTTARDAAHAAAAYVRSALISPRGHVCYTPLTDTLIHNANALGSGLLAACGRLCGDPELVRAAVEAIAATADALAPEGTWPYGEGSSLSWADNFHTAYTIDGVWMVALAAGSSDLMQVVRSAAHDWEHAYFGRSGFPSYYHDGSGPADVHSGATGVDLAARLAWFGIVSPDLASQVDQWMREHLVASDGVTTRYRRHRFWTDRRHFVRWGDAHWALARTSMALSRATCPPIIEDALAGSG